MDQRFDYLVRVKDGLACEGAHVAGSAIVNGGYGNGRSLMNLFLRI